MIAWQGVLCAYLASCSAQLPHHLLSFCEVERFSSQDFFYQVCLEKAVAGQENKDIKKQIGISTFLYSQGWEAVGGIGGWFWVNWEWIDLDRGEGGREREIAT